MYCDFRTSKRPAIFRILRLDTGIPEMHGVKNPNRGVTKVNTHFIFKNIIIRTPIQILFVIAINISLITVCYGNKLKVDPQLNWLSRMYQSIPKQEMPVFLSPSVKLPRDEEELRFTVFIIPHDRAQAGEDIRSGGGEILRERCRCGGQEAPRFCEEGHEEESGLASMLQNRVWKLTRRSIDFYILTFLLLQSLPINGLVKRDVEL